MIDSYQYLPTEELNPVNFPEIYTCEEYIKLLLDYSVLVISALNAYNTQSAGITYMPLNSKELSQYIDLCRAVCAYLGTVENPCFDIIIELRRAQNTMQVLLYHMNNTAKVVAK